MTSHMTRAAACNPAVLLLLQKAIHKLAYQLTYLLVSSARCARSCKAFASAFEPSKCLHMLHLMTAYAGFSYIIHFFLHTFITWTIVIASHQLKPFMAALFMAAMRIKSLAERGKQICA